MTSRLPKRLPVGTKYVVVSTGPLVRRFVELPNGKRISLPNRKALVAVEGVSIVPRQGRETLPVTSASG